jgi:hypothetical protein
MAGITSSWKGHYSTKVGKRGLVLRHQENKKEGDTILANELNACYAEAYFIL